MSTYLEKVSLKLHLMAAGTKYEKGDTRLIDAFYKKSGMNCELCGTFITNVFVIQNVKTGKTAKCGSVCITQHTHIPPEMVNELRNMLEREKKVAKRKDSILSTYAEEVEWLKMAIARGDDEGDGFLQAQLDRVTKQFVPIPEKYLKSIHRKMGKTENLRQKYASEVAFLESEINDGADEGDGFLQAVLDKILAGIEPKPSHMQAVRRKMEYKEKADELEPIRLAQQAKLDAILEKVTKEKDREFMMSLRQRTETAPLTEKQEFWMNKFYKELVGA